MIDPDDELVAWQLAQAPVGPEPPHRCSSDGPPCPACQEEIDEDDYREFGDA